MDELYKQRKFIYVMLILMVAVLAYYLIKTANFEGVKESEDATYAYVHISGCVKDEGWYMVKSEEIDLYSLIEKAGASASADLDKIEQKVYKSDLPVTDKGNRYLIVKVESPIIKTQVDINNCTAEDLTGLGLGADASEKIIRHREQNGEYENKRKLLSEGLLSEGEYGIICYSVYTFTDTYQIF